MQQYYLHNQFINNGSRKNVKPVKVNNKDLVCMTNDNIIEFYEYTENGIRYHAKQSINCNIARLEVLPTKQLHKDDYIFIVDKQGRYGVWRNESGFEVIENSPAQNECSLYKNDDEINQVSFSGEIHHFDVFDTKGSLFFSFKHTLVVINYSINRIGINIQKTTKISIPYVQYRYLNWVKSSKKGVFLGIIEQIQEKTILKVHNLGISSKINSQNLVYQRQKANLFEFVSQNDQLLLISDDELTGISLTKSYHQLYTHKIHNANGRVICVSEQTYCYIGQQMIVFNKGKLRSYGSFRQEAENIFQKKGVLQASCLKQTQDNGFMVCVSTLNNQLYFLILYENTWKLYYHLKALTSIYSIHPTTHSSVIAVMDQSIDQYQIVVVEKQGLTPLVKQQRCPVSIDKLISIDQGRFMVVGSQQANLLMRYNERTAEFDLVRELPKGNILLISNNIMITDSALYTVSLEDSFYQEIAKQDIILSAFNHERVIYMNADGVVKMITTEPFDISVVRSNTFDEYSWYLLENNDLLVARNSNILALYVYHQNNSISQIQLVENCLISSIHHFTYESQSIIEDTIVIGYMNGSIYLYSIEGELKGKLAGYCHEPVTFFKIDSELLGITSGSKQFVLLRKNNTNIVKAIEFSNSDNSIISVLFLEANKQFIFVQNDANTSGKLIRMIQLSDIRDSLNTSTNNHDSYRIKTIRGSLTEIPTVFLYGQFFLVGVNSSLHVYHMQSGRLLKTLTHYLKDVLGMMVLECGLVLYGIDSLERNLLYIYSHDFQEICFVNLILKDNKYIKTLRQIPNTNRFLCRGETFTTLCELNFNKEINEILQFKPDIQGYSLEIDSESHLLGESDSKRLLIVLSYENSMLPIARYVSPSEINDFLMLHRCILIGDKAGFLHLLEYNTQDPNEALRMAITKVASINVGQEVTTLSRHSPNQAFYGTVSGRIGSVQVISEEGYRLLKPAQEEGFKQLGRGRDFEYAGWRGRNVTDDKLIDGALVKHFLQDKGKRMLSEIERASFEETRAFFDRLAI